jgi:peptide/nickel transport system substrate-binding protein
MKTIRRRTWSIALACALATVCLAAALGASAALGQDETTAPAAGEKVVLKIGWVNEVDNLNPFIGWTDVVYEIWINEYLLMVGFDWDTMKPGPTSGIAKSWEVSDDGLVWTFHMNEGITWHDGEPCTSRDPVFTYNFIIENEISAYINFLAGVERAEVVDELTYRVICSQPVASMLTLWIPCLPEHIWGKLSAKEASLTFQNDPPHIGNGPYQVVEWKRNDYLRMAANKDFYLGAPTNDEIMFVVYQNGDTMVEDFLAGKLDAIYLFPPAQFDELKATEGIEAIEYPWYNWDYVGFNCYEGESGGHPALRDPQFRSALEYAVDREKMLETAYSGHGWVGYTFLPPESWKDPDFAWAPDASQARNYDPDMAKQILDDAGYPDTDGDGVREYKGKPIKLRLWADSGAADAQRACKLIAGWWRAVGVDVVFTVEDSGVYFDNIWGYEGDTFRPDFDAYYWSWDGYLDPGQTLTCFTTEQIEGWNEFSWANAEYQRLDDLQESELDPDKRAEYIHQMQEVMYEDCPCFTTVFPFKLQAYRTDKWDGWSRSLDGRGPAFLTAENPLAYWQLTPKAVEEDESQLGLWVAIIVAIVVVVGIVVWLIVRSRRGGPAMEE